MIKLRHWLGFKLGLILTIQITFVYSGITIEQLTKFNSTWTDFTLSSTDNVRKATNSDNESWCEVYMLTVMNEYNEQTHQKTQGWLVSANKPTRIFLIGNEHLTSASRVSFTKFDQSEQSDYCQLWPSDLSFDIEVLEKSNKGFTLAQAYIQLPTFDYDSWFYKFLGHTSTYHLCINYNSSSDLFRYTTEISSDSKILVFEELLPTWLKIFIGFIGVIMSFYLSGLVLGIMAIDITDLMLLKKAGTPTQKRHAAQLLPIRKNGNRILCTLLLANVAANSLVTVFMNNLISGWQTFIVSTLTLCIIGEIIPQAVFNRHGFILAAKSILFIKFLLYITAPFAFPIGMILDRILGDEAGMSYTRMQMKQLIELQNETGNLKLHKTEMHILQSALAMQKTQVDSLMIRISEVFMINHDSLLDMSTISSIASSGFTRIPVFKVDRTNIVNIINVKDLATINPNDNMSLETFCSFYKTHILFVPQNLSIIRLLQEFLKGKSHLAFVYQQTSSIQNQNEVDFSDKDKQSIKTQRQTSRRKRTTSNLSASLKIDFFLCNSVNSKNNRSLDNLNKLEDNIDKKLLHRKSICEDTGIFLVNQVEEVSDSLKVHMQNTIGIITLEDIFELILQEKIFDEKDLDPSTLKSSQKDFSILMRETGQKLPIYEKTLHAANLFLSTNILPFSPKFLSVNQLKTLLSRNIHQFTPSVEASELKLYRQNVRANYFVLIITGTGDVLVGKDNLKFPAHHFSHFGVRAILGDHEIKKDAINIDLNKDIKFIPDFSLTLTEKCIYIKITRQSYIESLKLGNRQKTAEAVNVHNETYRIRLLNASKAKINKDQNETKTLSKTAGLQRDSRYLDIFEADETVKDGTKQLFRLGSDDETTKAYLMQNKC